MRESNRSPKAIEAIFLCDIPIIVEVKWLLSIEE